MDEFNASGCVIYPMIEYTVIKPSIYSQREEMASSGASAPYIKIEEMHLKDPSLMIMEKKYSMKSSVICASWCAT